MKNKTKFYKAILILFLITVSVNVFSQTFHINYSVTQSPALNLTVSQTSSTCGASDGTASVSANGGTSPYTYQWTTGETTTTISNLASGMYMVTVTDAYGCSNYATAIVNDIGAPVITVNSATNITCFGGNNGAINVGITSSANPTQIEWSNCATTEDISGLTAGIYELIVTDNNGCVASKSYTITQPESLQINYTTTLANCGASDGSATVSVTGGTSPYTYTWSNGGSTSNIQLLTSNLYFITVTDASSCTSTLAVPVNEIGGPTITIDSIIDVSCGLANGAIYINVSGGISPYTYLWSNGATTSNIELLTSNIYNVTVTGNNNCSSALSNTAVIALPIPDPIGYVTVDTTTKKNKVVWKNIEPQEITHYNIYRESPQSEVYNLIATVPFGNDSIFMFSDSLSHPENRPWKYKISVIDVCGKESFLSNGHRTMHLKVKQVGNSAKLTWNSYEGFNFDYVHIYRSLPPQPYQLIDSVLANVGEYFDVAPPQGTVHYYIEVSDNNTVNKSILAVTNNTSRSNDDEEPIIVGITKVSQTGKLSIYPNPFDETTTIEFPNPNKNSVSISVMDITGKKVFETKTSNSKYEFSRKDLQKGVYFVKIAGGEVMYGKMIIK